MRRPWQGVAPRTPMAGDAPTGPPRASELLEQWFAGDGAKTLGSLNDLFGRGAFAVAFVLLLAVPALPLPTGGATHVFEIVAMLLALQLVIGREDVWLPQRFRRLELAGPRQQRFIERLMKLIRRLERLSRPRARFLFNHRASNIVFGVLVLAGSLGAFLAPPFTGLDTLPSLGVVLLSLGVILEDALVGIAGVVVGAAGVVLEIILGSAVVHGVTSLF
ncbi:MAG TPA: exopolysaccharide biosynthesis protein [Solirubrobacteraceae bacterium]|nr:exopolysaccharide biosynthesis protein [Solirubrobacteraceae bacterium]